jgi:autotransporter-associated beta strand protein
MTAGLCGSPLWGLILSALATGTAHAQLTSLTEGFDTVGSSGPPATGIFASGWVVTNNSSPLGNHDWGQGIPPGQLNSLGANAQSGAPNSFIQTDFQAGQAGSGAIVSDWLITPVLLLENGATMSFYTQASPANTQFPNELQVWESQSGSSTVNVGSTAPNPGGDFTVELLDINPGATNPSGSTGGYPTTWTQFTFTISGLSAPTDGRFGFRFYLPNANTDGTIVGIDTFSFADPTLFTRTVSGNWTDTTGWTPNGVPNGNTVTAQLVTPGSGANSVNLGGGTFTVNQLQFFGTGAGTWDVINGTIVFDGTSPTFVNQGGSSGIVGLLPSLQLNANTTFEIDNASAVTEVNGAISGTGGLTKTGSGALVLIGTNTYSGGTTISAGTLQIGNGGTTGSIVGDVADNGTLAFDRSDTVAFGSVISGTGGLVQVGSGTLVLTGNSTYTGGTTISAGTLQIGNGGTTGSITGNVTDNGTLTFDRSDIVTFSGVISGTGSLVQLGAGTLVLTADSNFSGTTTISAGILQFGNGGTTGGVNSSAIIDNGVLVIDHSDSFTYAGTVNGTGSGVKDGVGTLTLTGNNTYSGGTTINAGTLQLGNGGTTGSITGNVTDNGTLAFDRSDAVTFSGAISGTGSLAQLGSGTVTLTGNNTYSGVTTISAGTLQIGNGGTTGSIVGNVADNGTLAFDRSDAVTFSGAISGTGSVLQLGSGTVTLTGNSTYAGGTTISAGTLQIGNGGTNGSITGIVNDNGILAFDRSDAVTFSGVITGAGSLVQLGSGALVLTANHTYSGGTTISAGTLQLGNGGTSGSIIGNVTDNGSLAFDRSDSFTFTGAISGTGTVDQIGTGTLTLTGSNTYSGPTNVSSGTLRAGSATAFSAISAFSLTGLSVLDLNGFDASIGSLTGVAGATVSLGAHTLTTGGDNTSTLFAGTILGLGGGGLVKIGTGIFTLAGANTYPGGTTVGNGTVVAAASGALGSGPVSVTGASSNLQINSSVTLNNLVSLNNGGTLNNSGLLNEGSANLNVTNGGTIVNNPSGTITANQIQFTLAPAILVNSGTINANVTFANFANTVQLFTGSSIVGNLNLGTHTGTELILNGNGTGLLSQAITGTVTNSGSLVKQGTGTWTLDKNLSVPVATNVLAGFLVLDGQLTSPQVNVSTGATLQFGAGGSAGNLIGNVVVDNGSVIFNRSDSLTFNANISGSGGLNQNGTSTTILGGANTYSGGTVINAGTLVVNSSQALGLGNVTLNGGTLKADPQPINVKGNYTQNAGGTLQLAVDGPNPGQYDFLNVTGNASLNGTLALANGGFNPQANDKLTLVTTGGTVTGKFAAFSNPFVGGAGYNLVDLVYGKNSVVLEFLNQTTPVSPVPPKVPTTPGAPPTVATINFSSFAQTPNQRAAASLLDPIQLDPKSAALMSFLYSQPTSRFPDDFAKISPEGLTAFYEISFSGANIQKLNLEGRLDDIRNGCNGFNSNVKINGGSVSGPEGKTAVDGKYSKNTLEPVLQSGPGNRWGIWLTGFGDFVDVDSDSNAKGYDFTTGGVSLGVDYRIIDHLAVGVMANYSHTWTGLRPGHIGVDTGRGGIYATYFDRCFYLNGGIYGGYDSYDSSRDALGGMATEAPKALNSALFLAADTTSISVI